MDPVGPHPESTTSDVAAWVDTSRARWPLITLDTDGFQRHLAELERSVPVFPVDTYLAAACAHSDPAALRAFEEEFIARVPDVVRRIDASPAFASDVCQQVRIRLLVKDQAGLPRIARYTGEVPLSAWVRVIALRLALNAKRGNGALAEDESRADETTGMSDPEIEFLRGQYRETFVRSFKEALAALPKDDRTILRLHYVDGVNIDGIGRVFQVHRATVARWLVRIRSDLLESAKKILAGHLGAELDEAGSVIGVLAGEVDFTLSRILGKATSDPSAR